MQIDVIKAITYKFNVRQFLFVPSKQNLKNENYIRSFQFEPTTIWTGT